MFSSLPSAHGLGTAKTLISPFTPHVPRGLSPLSPPSTPVTCKSLGRLRQLCCRNCRFLQLLPSRQLSLNCCMLPCFPFIVLSASASTIMLLQPNLRLTATTRDGRRTGGGREHRTRSLPLGRSLVPRPLLVTVELRYARGAIPLASATSIVSRAGVQVAG